MYTQKLHAGSAFPDINVTSPSGETLNLAAIDPDYDWKLVVIYRGRHCPLCTRYLNELENHRQDLNELGVEIDPALKLVGWPE